LLTITSVDDDAALRSKVDEALAVYDDYMKSRKDGANGTKEDEAGAEANAA
jgi:hypothetical protein